MHAAVEAFLKIFSFSVIRYFLVAGIPFVMCYKLLKDKLEHLRIQNKSAAAKDFKREILHSLQTTAVLTFVGILVFFTPFKHYTRIYTGADYPFWWVGVSLVISLVIHDTYFYWMHRLLHSPKLFRYTHLLHHKSITPSPFTAYSFHFIEACTEGCVLFIIVLVLPVNLLTITLFVFVGFIINVYGHLGYEIAPKWLRKTFLFEVLNTSVYHNLHHSKFKGNYGLYFRVWDRLMGTENPDYVKEYDHIQQKRNNRDRAVVISE